MTLHPANDNYLTSQKVRERFGVSDMTLWRWLSDEQVGFTPMIMEQIGVLGMSGMMDEIIPEMMEQMGCRRERPDMTDRET